MNETIITRVKDVPPTEDFHFETKTCGANIHVSNRGYGGSAEVRLGSPSQVFMPADLRQAAKLFLRLADDLEVEAAD